MKSYDVGESGNYGKGNSNVEKYGSSKWSNSNIREWLNSADKKVNYTTMQPNEKTIPTWHTYYNNKRYNFLPKDMAYDKEKGFLYYFSENEISLINSIKHDDVFDKVFIPSLYELKRINDLGFSLYADYGKTCKNESLVGANGKYWNRTSSDGNCKEKYKKDISSGKKYHDDEYNLSFANIRDSDYKLNEIDSSGSYVYTNKEKGMWYYYYTVRYNAVYACYYSGVRPMIYLKDTLVINNGEGTRDNPYTLDIRKCNNSLADVPKNHWAYESIKYLLEKDIIKVNADGTIKPNDNISTIKFLELLSMGTNYNYYEKKTKFSEIKDEHWMNELVKIGSYCVDKCEENGERYNGKFNISREDAADILIYALDLQDEGYKDNTLNKFSDKNDIECKDSIAIAVENNLMIGLNGKFEPNKSLTNAEAYMILYRIIKGEF
jgi:S-layer family protein